jgi:hypothetical protein
MIHPAPGSEYVAMSILKSRAALWRTLGALLLIGLSRAALANEVAAVRAGEPVTVNGVLDEASGKARRCWTTSTRPIRVITAFRL